MQHPSTEPEAPRFCPLCGHDSHSDTIEIKIPFKRAITAPHIAKSIGKAGDQTYRMMEETAQDRIAQAAELTGLPESDFADMKITDLKDNLREGDIAAKEIDKNPVTERMEAMASAGLPVGHVSPIPPVQNAPVAIPAGRAPQIAPQQYAQTTGVGPHPYAGARARMSVNEHFVRQGRAVIDAKTTGSYAGGS